LIGRDEAQREHKHVDCGGAGGELWMEKHQGERLSDLRIEERYQNGRHLFGYTFPYAITYVEDSIGHSMLNEKFQ